MKKFNEVVDSINGLKDTFELFPTGFRKMDEFLDGGFMRKELVILGGATGRGKSFIAGTIFQHIASKGFRCAYFSLEISNEMVVSRLIGASANIKPTRIMMGLLTAEEYKSKMEAKAKLSAYENFMFFYDDVYLLEVIKKEVREGKYDFVIIDFVQNIIAKESDEYARLSSIALELQKFAKEMNCCILILSQLSNTMSREKNSSIVEYKGSGSIATVCDLGFFIESNEAEPDKFRIRLRKNRRGISGVAWEFTFVQPGGKIISL